jgi:ribosomal protein S21
VSNLTVEVFNGDVTSALARFKKLSVRTGLLKEFRRHESYVTPSERRRRKAKVARARLTRVAKRQAAGEAARLLRMGLSADD